MRPEVEQQQNGWQAYGSGLRHERQGAEDEPSRVAPPRGALDIPQVGRDRSQEESGAQHILAFGEPGEGLDAERVQRPEEGGGGGYPSRRAQTEEDQKQQAGADGVQQDAREVVTS